MCMHILFCVCIGGLGLGLGDFHPTPQRKKAREVYALCFVRTSSYATDLTIYFNVMLNFIGTNVMRKLLTTGYANAMGMMLKQMKSQDIDI